MSPVYPMAAYPECCHITAMLTEIYIEALLVDEEAADQVWEIWDKGEIDDCTACAGWRIIGSVGHLLNLLVDG